RNIIIQVDKAELENLPPGYVLSDYGTLNLLTQINNCVNIQLRNLLSLLEI
ncbi:MAG: NDP-hexose 2,3-dehydratase family protein, partial [Lachnospiraceae bacterium]|nr:NDP-hexose 2,3-dehydratase family protein [Lachnospiraceae bacterium]